MLKEEIVSVAVPELSRVAVFRVLEPSLKVTFPVGIPDEDVTAAVKTTDWLLVDGFVDETRLVVVEAGDPAKVFGV